MTFDSSPSGNDAISQINVTPLVDVMLVLLVIFMVTAPIVLKDSLNIKLPTAASLDQKSSQPLGVVVTKAGQVLVSGKTATKESLTELVKETLAKDPAASAIIAADTEAMHGDVVRAIDWLKQAGMNQFAIQIERQ